MDDYLLIRSSRRTLTLEISREGHLIVRAPIRLSVSQIEDFIEKKQDWIGKHQNIEKEKSLQRKQYSEGEIREMKQALNSYIRVRVHELWKDKWLPIITTMKITKSEKRWGSCSGRNSLCFSYRLAEYLEKNTQVIDAIIYHELAHLKEKNHGKKFWNLVYSWSPQYNSHIQLLKGWIE